MNFVISGILKDRKTDTTMKKYAGYVSKEFYEAQVPPKERIYSVYFRLADSIDITYDDADDLLKELADKCGISEENVSVNDYYLIWALDPGKETLSGGILIAICVILFSVIVIYNIFQVGIVQKIQEYGKLKAIGATRKQLKGIVLREGMQLALIGIPIGLMLGSAIGELVFSWLMKQSNAIRAGEDLIEVSIFSAPIILLVIGVSILTVYIALRKPMRIVARISSIEAIRYQENGRGKRTVRKGRKIVGANALMVASLSGNRRRTIVTVCTMGLSCVLLVVIANFVENIDSKYAARGDIEYGQFQISLDYSLEDTAYPENNLDRILKDNPLNEDMIAQIKQLDGVTNVRTRKVLVMKRLDVTGKGSSGLSSVAVVNHEEFNRLKNQGESVGHCDYDLVTEENALLFGWSDFLEYNGYAIGQKMQIQLVNGINSLSLDSRILGSVAYCNQDWVITEDTYRKLGFEEGGIGYVWVDCKEEDIQTVNKELNELLSGINHIELNTFQDAYKMSQFSTLIMRLTSYAFLAILGIIGFLNMANTIIVSIITRKQELGILQAIGMTNRQLKRMLQIEGCIYTVGTVLVAMIVGIPAGYAFFLYGKSNSWVGLNIYHFPLAVILIMVAVIAVMQFILSFVLSRNIRKESLVERIRYQE
jgi:putative ABC transport system permease protein